MLNKFNHTKDTVSWRNLHSWVFISGFFGLFIYFHIPVLSMLPSLVSFLKDLVNLINGLSMKAIWLFLIISSYQLAHKMMEEKIYNLPAHIKSVS